MLLINGEITLILIWLSTCINTNLGGAVTFAIPDTKLCVAVVT